MEPNLLELFFEANYYINTCIEDGLCAEGEVNLTNALEHYKQHGIENCSPPNEYFNNHKNFLYNNAKECMLSDWQKKMSTISSMDRDVVNSYMVHVFTKNRQNDIATIISKYASNSPGELECLLGQSKLLDTILVAAFKQKPNHVLKESSAIYLEKSLLEVGLKSAIAPIIINYAARYATNSSHAIFLGQLLQKNEYISILDPLSNAFSYALHNEKRCFDADVFKAFEPAAQLTQPNKYMLDFMANGAVKEIYYPQKPYYIDLFRGQIKNQDEGVSEAQQGLSAFFLEALCGTMYSQMDNKVIKSSVIKETVDYILGKGYSLPLNLIDKIIDHYQNKASIIIKSSREVGGDETEAEVRVLREKEIVLLTSALEKIIENYKPLPKYTLDKLVVASLQLIESSENNSIIKNVIFIASRLFQQHFEFPDDTLSYFSKLVSSQDTNIQKLSLALFKKLSGKLPVPNVDDLLNIANHLNVTSVLNNLEDLDNNLISGNEKHSPLDLTRDLKIKGDGYVNIRSEIVDILQNGMMHVGLSNDHIQQLQILKKENEEYLKKERSERIINDCIEKIRKQDASLWAGEKRKVWERRLHYIFTKADWPLESVNRVIDKLNNLTIKEFDRAVEEISDFSMSHKLLNRDGMNIVDVIENVDPSKWVTAIQELFKENRYYTSRNKKELLDEILISNKECLDDLNQGCNLNVVLSDEIKKDVVEKLKAITAFENKYEYKLSYANSSALSNTAISLSLKKGKLYAHMVGKQEIELVTSSVEEVGVSQNLYNKILKELSSLVQLKEFSFTLNEENELHTFMAAHGYANIKKLTLWSNEDFESWKKQITKITEGNVGEVIAVMKQAIFKTGIDKDHFYPRDIQIISLLIFLQAQAGRLAQISTGEGKSVIIAMLAAIKVLDGRHVDIVTSSPDLAMRDASKYEGFYRLLGITVKENISPADENETLKKCYNANIVYGTLLHFIGDNLSDITDNVKDGRGFDVVIIDEVDNMFIDETSKQVLRSPGIPGFESLKKMLIYTWGFQQLLFSLVRKDQDTERYYLTKPLFDEDDIKKVKFIDVEEIINPDEFFRNETIAFVEKKLFSFDSLTEDRGIVFPKHMEGFIKSQLTKWVSSSFEARNHVENQTYVVRDSLYYQEDLPPHRVIAPVNLDTGVVQFKLNWGDGLTQFLQIKHGLQMNSESLVSVFQSYVGYFLKYSGNIYGLTGTLGTAKHQEFLHEIYKVDFVLIPNHIQKKLTIFPDVVTRNDHDQWMRNIVEVTQRRAVEDNRPVLIVAKTIEAMLQISMALKEALEDNVSRGECTIKEYGESADQSAISAIARAGDIIVATNLAGRGTDLKITHDAEKNGGLHVIMSYLPTSIRVEEQGFGRAARNGESGSAQLVIDVKHLDTADVGDKDLVSYLSNKRNGKESDNLSKDRFCKVPNMRLKDDLFDQYVDLIRNYIDSPTGIKLIVGYKNQNCAKSKDQACIYMQADDIYLKASTSYDYQESFKITDDLKKVDKKIYNHISSILSKPNNPTNLSKRDAELIHFLLAKKGYSTEGAAVVKRIEDRYTSLLPTEPVISDPIMKLWKKEKSSWANIAASIASVVIQLSDRLGQFSPQEISYLEGLLKYEGNYDPYKATKEDFLNIKLKNLYSLWLEDRNTYTKEFETLQIQELWAVWLKKQEALIASKDACPNLIKEYNINKIQIDENGKAVKNLLLSNLKEFKKDIVDKDKNKTLFHNPAYMIRKAFDLQNIHDYQVRLSKNINSGGWTEKLGAIWESWGYISNPLNDAVKLLESAANKDHEHSWPAHNGLAFMHVVKDSPKIRYKEDAGEAMRVKGLFSRCSNEALGKLYGITIPQIEAQLIYLVNNNITTIHSDLAMQLLVAIKLHQEIGNTIEKNINMTNSAGEEQMIRVSQVLVLENLFDKHNATDHMGKYFNLTTLDTQSINLLSKAATSFNITMHRDTTNELYQSGAMAFQIEIYDLKSDEDWFGTIFSTVLGVAQIFIGVAMLGVGGPFMTSLGYSMVAGGIGDILSSIVSVSTGVPINMDDYLKAKSISLAISIVAAGITYLATDLIKGFTIENFAKDAKMSEFIMEEFAFQAALMGAGTLLQNAGKQVLNHNDGQIKDEIREEIEFLLNSRYTELKVIFAADNAMNGQLLNKLIAEAYEISRDYAKRFNSDFATGLKGVAPTAARTFGRMAAVAATVATSGVNAGLGYIKVSEATDDFTERFDGIIKNMANSITLRTREMMQNKLEYSFEGRGAQIMNLLNSHGFVTSADIDYQHCDRIEKFELGEIENLREAIISACGKIAKLMSDENMSGKRDMLSDNLQNIVFSNVKGMIRSDIIPQISNIATGVMGEYAREFIQKRHDLQKLNEKLKQVAAEKSEEGGYQAPKVNRYSDTSQYTETAAKTRTTHTVKKGDTIWDIAEDNGQTIEALLKANPNLKINKNGYVYIQPGDRVFIPVDSQSSHVIMADVGGTSSSVQPKAHNLVRQEMLEQLQLVEEIYASSDSYDQVDIMANEFGKGVDKSWVYGKAATKALLAIGAEKFAENFPNTAEKLLEVARYGGDKLTAGIDKADQSLGEVFGNEYHELKAGISELKLSDKTPIIVKDLLVLMAEAAAGKALLAPLEGLAALKLVKKVDLGGAKVDSYLHQQPDVPNGKIKTDNKIPGVDEPFRGENMLYPADHKLVNFMNSPDMRRYISYTGTDCSEIADKIFKASGSIGKILEVTPKKPGTLVLFEDGKKSLPEFYYHQVFSDGKYVYDPRLSSNPIPKGDWESMVRRLNPDGVIIK